MQDIQSSLFAGGIDRRLNTAYHHGFADGHGGSLKCPRCGSSNTKFCYYNNYNLSQPRFFCKGCRRYWTKGGVLRNVPIGGGSRKTKRSKQKTANGKPSSVNLATTSERKPTDSQNSSSDSSVVVANISPETKPTEAVPTMFNQSFEPPMQTDSHQLFSEIGINFRSLMTSSIDELALGFISAPPEVSSVTQQVDQDQVVENNNWSNNGGIAAEDWGLVDQSYWLSNSDHQLNYLV